MKPKKNRVFHCAASRGQLKCLTILLNENSSIWVRNRNGDYPIHEAFINKHLGRLFYNDSTQSNVLKFIIFVYFEECVYLFLKKISGPKVANSTNIYNGCSILHLAAVENDLKLCKRLVACGASLDSLMKVSKVKKSSFKVQVLVD